MSYKSNTGASWSLLELMGLLEDEDAHVYFEKAKRHLGLHPFHLTNLNTALREILDSSLYRYDTNLNGIILSYKNPKLLSALGDVLYDSHFVHVDIEADFYVFRPEVGCSLKGIVNKKGEDHVGVLIHKVINVTIPKPEDDDEDDCENWPGCKVNVGQEVKFSVTFIDFKGRLPYIRGVFKEEDYLRGCKLFGVEVEDACNTKDQDRTIINNLQHVVNIDNVSVCGTPRKAKGERNKHLTVCDDIKQQEEATANETASAKKSIKRLKKLHVNSSDAANSETKIKTSKSLTNQKELYAEKVKSTKHAVTFMEDEEVVPAKLSKLIKLQTHSKKMKIEKSIDNSEINVTVDERETVDTSTRKKRKKKYSISEGDVKREKVQNDVPIEEEMSTVKVKKRRETQSDDNVKKEHINTTEVKKIQHVRTDIEKVVDEEAGTVRGKEEDGGVEEMSTVKVKRKRHHSRTDVDVTDRKKTSFAKETKRQNESDNCDAEGKEMEPLKLRDEQKILLNGDDVVDVKTKPLKEKKKRVILSDSSDEAMSGTHSLKVMNAKKSRLSSDDEEEEEVMSSPKTKNRKNSVNGTPEKTSSLKVKRKSHTMSDSEDSEVTVKSPSKNKMKKLKIKSEPISCDSSDLDIKPTLS